MRIPVMVSLCVVTLAFLVTDVAVAQQRAVTNVVAVAKPKRYEGRCPASIEFVGTIFVSRPTTVSYRWERSDHATGPVQTVTINSAGQGVTARWQLSRPVGEVF